MFNWLSTWWYGKKEEVIEDNVSQDSVASRKLTDSLLLMGDVMVITEENLPEIIRPMQLNEEIENFDRSNLRSIQPAAARRLPVQKIAYMPKSMIVITNADIKKALCQLKHVDIDPTPKEVPQSPLIQELHKTFVEKCLEEKNYVVTN